jgi:hypothetical protein
MERIEQSFGVLGYTSMRRSGFHPCFLLSFVLFMSPPNEFQRIDGLHCKIPSTLINTFRLEAWMSRVSCEYQTPVKGIVVQVVKCHKDSDGTYEVQ